MPIFEIVSRWRCTGILCPKCGYDMYAIPGAEETTCANNDCLHTLTMVEARDIIAELQAKIDNQPK